MLVTKYQKDMNHNYLIVKCPPAASGGYQLRMMCDNDIPGLLPADKRHIDGEVYLYYEVNSLQTLRSLFERRKMDRDMAVALLGGLRRSLRELNNYLLGEDGLILRPEYIFLDWERAEAYFVYYPFERETEPGQFLHLMEYMARIIDHRDAQLTDAVYGLFQLAERDTFTVGELDEYLAAISLGRDEGSDVAPAEEREAVIESTAPEPVFAMPEEDGAAREKKQRATFLILTAVAAMGAAFTAFYRLFFALTIRERLLSWILLIVFVIFFLISGAIFLLLMYRAGRAQKGAAPELFCPEAGEAGTPLADDMCGDTVFISDDDEEDENRLYGISAGNKQVIEISVFPFTIGKRAENCDFCLKDGSISRIHARLSRSGEGVFLTDLNSTNGTYKNGLRLEPSETVPLAVGDEVRLGRLEFCWR